jgi:peroxiredoxin
MMKTFAFATLVGAFALASTTAKEIGKPAPSFSAETLKGESVSLADLKGKVVVLEWVNFDCPFVKKHYSSGNLPTLQETYGKKDVVWITVNSNAPQGAVDTSAVAARAEKEGHKGTHFVLDPDGTIGKAYDAKVTPHLYIINKEGTLVYNGAIDSIASTDLDDLEKADKLFANALDATLEGKKVENAKNQPYGCGVKYAD